jgi:hypothetical protein
MEWKMMQKVKTVFTIWLFSFFQPRNSTGEQMKLYCRLSGILSVILLLIAAILISCTSNKDITGTSVVGNPESVSAIIVDKNGVPQRNIPVALIPADYNAVKQNDTMSIIQGKTDTSGRVVLRLGSDTVYNLTSTNDFYRYELLEKVSISDSVKNLNNKTIELGRVQLKDPGIILVTIDSSSYSFGSYLAIPGTLIKMEVDTPGTYTLKSPAGIVDVEYCNVSYDTADEKTIDSVVVNSSGIVKITTSNQDVVISADTTIINDTIVFVDTLDMEDTIIKVDTMHFMDTLNTTSPVLYVDTVNTTDTIYKNSQVLHGIKTVEHVDSVVTSDTTYSGDTATVITTLKRITGKDIIDTTKKFDTLWLMSSIKEIITTGTINNTNYIDSVQTRSTIIKRIVYRTTRRIISISNIIVTSIPYTQTNQTDTSVKKDTLVRTDIKEVFDSLIIPDTSAQIEKSVDTTVIAKDTLLLKDTSLAIDTMKSSKVSYSIDTIVYKDSTIHIDTVKFLIVYPDSVVPPVTYYDFHSDGSSPEFEGIHNLCIPVNMVLSVINNNCNPVNDNIINKSKNFSYWFRSRSDSEKDIFMTPV